MKGVSIEDRIVSLLAYYTCGIFSIIWIIYANITKKRMTPFLVFNMYQAIFVSVILAAISLLYSIAINILAVIPFIGNLVKGFDIFFNATPLYYGFTISGIFTVLLLTYLALFSVLGKRPYLPIISDIINCNFGG